MENAGERSDATANGQDALRLGQCSDHALFFHGRTRRGQPLLIDVRTVADADGDETAWLARMSVDDEVTHFRDILDIESETLRALLTSLEERAGEMEVVSNFRLKIQVTLEEQANRAEEWLGNSSGDGWRAVRTCWASTKLR